MLTGDSGELCELAKEVDAMICKLGESAETKTSHYLQQCAGEDDTSTALFWVSKPRDSSSGIVELAKSKALMQIVKARKKGKGRHRKEFVEPPNGTLMLSKNWNANLRKRPISMLTSKIQWPFWTGKRTPELSRIRKNLN